MPKSSSSKEINDDEIDLLDLFRRIGRTLSNWFRALGKGLIISIIFLMKNILPLVISIIIGIGLSFLIKWSLKPEYVSEITLRSNTLPNDEMIAYFNKLTILLKEKNYSQISTLLSLAPEKARELKDIEAFWVIDKNRDQIPDYVDYRNRFNVYDTLNARMRDRFVVDVKLYNPKNLPDITKGFMNYVSLNSTFALSNEFRLKKDDELLARLNYDIKQLDSLQKVKYFEETRNRIPEKGGQMIFLQDQKTQLVYDDIYTLYQKKQSLDQEKEIYPGLLTVISDFYQPIKRFNGAFYYGKVVIPVVFAITLIMLIMQRNRKKLREIYKEY